MRHAIVFAGPSLPRGTTMPDGVELRPPAGLGDVLRATLAEPAPRLIGVVDGVFEGGPPVRHKEILHAMSLGIRVMGAASIGALRAAELAAYGMEPIGLIARAFCEERLLGEPFGDDDEVAVVHGPAELSYPQASDAMVDIRLSLAAAASAGIVSAEAASSLASLAKARFFKDRRYDTMLDDARRAGLDQRQLDGLADWLVSNRIEQKRQDALALLAEIVEPAERPSGLVQRGFEPTAAWLDLVASTAGDRDGFADGEVEEEVLLRPDLAAEVYGAALFEALREREAARRGWPDGEIGAMIDRFRPILNKRLPDLLRRRGVWPELERAVRAKRGLTEGGLPALSRLHVTELSLVRWHCDQLGVGGPASIEGWAQHLGFANADTMIEALAKEYVYRRDGGR